MVEFFVTASQTATFITFFGFIQCMHVVVGLAIGGVVAAPIAAFCCKKIHTKSLMCMIGIIIIFLNVRSLLLLILR